MIRHKYKYREDINTIIKDKCQKLLISFILQLMGTLLEVARIGSMHVEHIGLLSRVLHLPKIFVSLVSIQRVAKLNKFRIIFEDIDAILCNKVHG